MVDVEQASRIRSGGVLAVVPARSGSKGLKNKNIRVLAGKPLIAWSIEAALRAECIDRVIVTTDCEKIAECAVRYGAEVPFLRPAHLADDYASSEAVLLHALQAEPFSEEFVVLLQPTSPLRNATDIDKAFSLLVKSSMEACLSVTMVSDSPWLMHSMSDTNICTRLLPRLGNMRRQDLPPCYQVNGAIYMLRISEFLKNKTLAPETFLGSEMVLSQSIDIDTLQDFEAAESLLMRRL